MHTSAGAHGRKRVVMIATENDSLKGAKVGGIGDVIRDLPGELAPLGWDATVIIPSYGFLHTLNGAVKAADVTFPFGGREEFCEVWKAEGDGTEHLILHHDAIRGEPIYYDDPKDRVFERDSTKFALFCSAAGQYLRTMEEPYVLHLHDWHTGYLFILAELHPSFTHLRKVRKVFTIHNIGYQGTRPMRKFSPSLEDWYPELFRKTAWMREWEDARYDVPTFTPMLAGIRHASAVTTVSPTYASEITRRSDHANAAYGGEGLEAALRGAHDESRLFGILNGVRYPPAAGREAVDDAGLLETILGELSTEKRAGSPFYHDEVVRRLRRILDGSRRFLASSITRITEQKVRLMFEKGSAGGTAIESILDILGRHGAAYVMVGSGSDGYEEALKQAFLRHECFIFLNGFYRRSAAALFRRGNLFVMPSSYEPCGITQMQAMREGQPCLVHAVGGLKDTVVEGVNGFTFNGATLVEKVDNFVAAAGRALGVHRNEPARWAALVKAAGEARFGWEESARAYVALYEGRQPVRPHQGAPQTHL